VARDTEAAHGAPSRAEGASAAPWAGFTTLLYKELLRFWKVGVQTIAAPVFTALLHLVIFGHVFEGRVQVYGELSYTAFLVPGLVMMSMLQNAFANSASSLTQSKVTGNIVFVLLPPLSYAEFFAAYVLAAAARGLVVGAGVLAVALPLRCRSPTRCGRSRSRSPAARSSARSA
jgi:ABC-2 type transport system permease protein